MVSIDLSVIVPVYNSADTIIESLTSIIEECSCNPYNWELIIVNDGSSDNSLSLISEFIKNSRFHNNIKLISQQNSGASKARNEGIKISKGKFIAFNDSDDRWLKGKISLQMKFLLSRPEIDMLGGIFGQDSYWICSSLKMNSFIRINIKQQVFKNYFSPPTVIFRRSALKHTGLFNEKLKYAEEGYFFNRMVYFHNCLILNKQVAENITPKYRWGESGLSGNLIRMELGELNNIRAAYKSNFISFYIYILAIIFSIAKFLRRFIISKIRALCR